jgi:PPP family 3-phenylpropionic acid transporter
MALVDSATLSMLGDQRDLYGRIRIWGTIGWGLSAPLVGVLLQRYGLQWMFWIYALLMIINLIPIRRLEFSFQSSTISFRQGMLSVLADRRWLSVLIMIFVTAIGLTAHTNYMSVLLNEMGATKTTVGIAVAISTIFELPVLFFSNYLLRKFKTQGLLLLAMGVTGLRCVLYSFAGSPQAVLAIQCLHGLTFPALWVAGVTYASENAPEGLIASTQGLLSAVLMGLGAGAGGLIGGLLIDSLGVSGMFGVIGAAVLIGLVVFLIIERFWDSSG